MSAKQPPCCLVTGAAGGIGRALVDVFQRAGYAVIATDLCARPADLPCTQYLQADLGRTVDEEAYAAEIFSIISQWLPPEGLKALINNAAVQVLGGVDALSRQDWAQTLNVNLMAPFVWTQALLQPLEIAQGSVVNISSIHARLTKKGFVAYATSKAALSGMTRAMAVDLQDRVRVNAIEPAAVGTEMLKAGFKHAPESYKQLENCHPQLRVAEPQEVARLAHAIVEGGALFLHGSCIDMSGGIGARLYDPL